MGRDPYHFREKILGAVVGGMSSLDIPRLNIPNMERANDFIHGYGYDWDNLKDREQLWSFHQRAVMLMREVLLADGEVIPGELAEKDQLGHLGYLLINASMEPHIDNVTQKWSCAILRVMHVLVLLKNDLSQFYLQEIQAQILRPYSKFIQKGTASGCVFLGKDSDSEQINLQRFDVKPLKTSTSSVIKLLAKPNTTVLDILDRLGVRFVTRDIFDAFRVVRFLVEKGIVSFPHNIPDQAKNTLYPINLFLEVMESLKGTADEHDPDKIKLHLETKLSVAEWRAKYTEKENLFSAVDYQSIKFITRRRIRVSQAVGSQSEELSFFYPYEIQIMDYETYLKTLSGPIAHDKYKERQIKAARCRVLGLSNLESEKKSK